ncbi:MAG: 16S rRNA (cytidine(1402)-2'-O)-methyltransferase [Lachnospiraceae bacterium]|nr:16S rRNA (cytidine(1402)-2'-O)-methyltransferase [Lachnospiraceae bacterium]
MAGKLYLCATPIGNLDDITFRVVDTLKNVDLIAAEDTRHTIKLLNHYDIKTKMTSYHEHNKYEKAEVLVAELLKGTNIALVTDAGTPGISDPGEELVKQALAAGIEVTSLPGPAALIVAVSMCGLSSRRFVFEGFLPTVKRERKEALARLENETRTIVIYEAPHRFLKTLKDLQDVLGDREIRICRELTKVHESVLAITIADAIKLYEENEPKGEMVVVIKGKDEEEIAQEERASWEEMSVKDHVEHYMQQGLSEKDAMKQAARDRGLSKRDIYDEIKK